MSYIPGPWYISQNPNEPYTVKAKIPGFEAYSIVAVCNDFDLKVEANARLIAVAPEMYDALLMALGFVVASSSLENDVAKFIQAALDKADGK